VLGEGEELRAQVAAGKNILSTLVEAYWLALDRGQPEDAWASCFVLTTTNDDIMPGRRSKSNQELCAILHRRW
jgi:hypothetical protein